MVKDAKNELEKFWLDCSGYTNCDVVPLNMLFKQVVCKDKLKTCVQEASGFWNKSRCYREFGKCLINKGPSTFVMDAIEDGEPDRHPYMVSTSSKHAKRFSVLLTLLSNAISKY